MDFLLIRDITRIDSLELVTACHVGAWSEMHLFIFFRFIFTLRTLRKIERKPLKSIEFELIFYMFLAMPCEFLSAGNWPTTLLAMPKWHVHTGHRSIFDGALPATELLQNKVPKSRNLCCPKPQGKYNFITHELFYLLMSGRALKSKSHISPRERDK